MTSQERTILGVPVVDGCAVTPLGVVRARDSFGERYYDWYPLGDAAVVAFCDPPDADRVLRALWDAGRVAGLREATALADAEIFRATMAARPRDRHAAGCTSAAGRLRDELMALADRIERGEP